MGSFVVVISWLVTLSASTISGFSFPMHMAQRNPLLHRATKLRQSKNIDILDEPSIVQERRGFLTSVAGSVPLLTLLVKQANASGGATAGGVYLLSAKQRYNERVKASVKSLLQISDALKNGDPNPAKAYFESEDGGSWKDLTAAGYLLSNAFRRNSTAPPDSLPAVKKYKVFAADIADFQKILKKKGAAAASDSFPTVEAALNDWLNEIELPSAREL